MCIPSDMPMKLHIEQKRLYFDSTPNSQLKQNLRLRGKIYGYCSKEIILGWPATEEALGWAPNEPDLAIPKQAVSQLG